MAATSHVRVLVVSTSDETGGMLDRRLTAAGFDTAVYPADSIPDTTPDVVVLPDDGTSDPNALLAALPTRVTDEVPVVVWSPERGDSRAVSLFRAGAADCVTGADDQGLAELTERVAAVVDQQDEPARGGERVATAEDSIWNHIPEMVYALDSDGRVVLATPRLLDRLGYRRETLVGTHVSVVLADENVETGGEQIRNLLASDDRDTAQYRTKLRTRQGQTFPAEIEVTLRMSGSEFVGTVGVVRDLSELAATEERLAAERDRVSHLFETIPDAIVEAEIEDGTPIVRRVNPGFEETFGWDAEAVIGESLNDYVLPDEDTDVGRQLDERAERGLVNQRRVVRRTATGERQFLFRGVPYRETDDGTLAFGVYTDVTEQVDRERRLQVLHRILRHNLRNKMTVISGYAETLTRTLDGEERAYAQSLLNAADTVVELTQKAQVLERLSETDGSPTVDVTAAAESVLQTVERRYANVDVQFDGPETAHVYAHPQLEVALMNVVENAVEHNRADTPTVVVEVELSGEVADVTVADDGPGIPEQELAVVLGEREITQLEHASGLGLWLVRHIVAASGGSVTFAESDLGGSAVTMHLPAVQQRT
ncbi:PAS domain S-box protein [Haloarchaeobius sp. DYHT-AS-18]|uniref:PAS domain S-box protein n=1 Tax=Haloarchaeobius sp. DYHT-AS-18 TaxID=3446117 RepID=UPI003EB92572